MNSTDEFQCVYYRYIIYYIIYHIILLFFPDMWHKNNMFGGVGSRFLRTYVNMLRIWLKNCLFFYTFSSVFLEIKNQFFTYLNVFENYTLLAVRVYKCHIVQV